MKSQNWKGLKNFRKLVKLKGQNLSKQFFEGNCKKSKKIDSEVQKKTSEKLKLKLKA